MGKRLLTHIHPQKPLPKKKKSKQQTPRLFIPALLWHLFHAIFVMYIRVISSWRSKTLCSLVYVLPLEQEQHLRSSSVYIQPRTQRWQRGSRKTVKNEAPGKEI
jgi:hypothetical protein